jgi:hypothetical protein
VSGHSQIETDYLVVGAGAVGMAFVDSLIEHSDADVVMIDRRPRPGGHWLDSYPFVQLHQPSRFYGVNSTSLGHESVEPADGELGSSERASGPEIVGYFDEIMRHRFDASKRVRFFPMSEYLGECRFRSRLTAQVTDVTVRRSVVDATYLASRVPATEPPPFEVADGARCIPVGQLVTIDQPPAGYVIVGGGKTAMDAICWLLDQATAPDAITWIRPQDSWLLNRSYFQPGKLRTFEGIVLQLEATAASASVNEVFERLEQHDEVVRTDTTIVPTMMRGATVSLRELEQLRRVENVVRLGYVHRIESDQIVLQNGAVATSPQHLHVHCAAPGIAANPPRPIFTDDEITLQVVTRVAITLSAALLGFVESTGRTTDEKNRLCPPNGQFQTPLGYLRGIMGGIRTEMSWTDAADLQRWLDGSRLNLMCGLQNEDRDALRALQLRFFEALGPAFEKLDTFAA